MAIRRNRVDRSPSLNLDVDSRVVDLPPSWAFTIRCTQNGADYPFDFTSYRTNGREPLAIQMRDAIWSMRRELTGKSLTSYVNSGILPFWRFLDDLASAGQSVISLEQIDRNLLMQFMAWMEVQIVVAGKNRGQQWSLAARRGAYSNLKAVLLNRQRHAPDMVNPGLTFPKNPYPNSGQKIPRRQEYTNSEQDRMLDACRADLRLFRNDNNALSSHQVLTVHAIIAVLTCGVNMTPLLEMRRDSLRTFLPDRDLLLLEKRRGYTTRAMSLPKSQDQEEAATSIPKNIGDYLRQLQCYTAQFAAEADSADKDFVFLCRIKDGAASNRRGMVARFDEVQAKNSLRRFVERHDLRDDHGQRLRLSLTRLRPTFALNFYRRTRDVRKVQQALGHSTPAITVQRYLPSVTPEAERNHAFVGQAMVGWATSTDHIQAIKLAADGKIPLKDATELLAGGYNTSIARCRNPFREGGSVCGKFLACFRCPSMIVFEDDLHRLFSFYYRILSERPKIHSHHWMKTFGPVIKIIEEQIAVQFDVSIVDAARKLAQDSPHPAWRIGGSVL